MAGYVEAVQLIILLGHRRVDVPANTWSERQPGSDLVVVAQVQAGRFVVQPQISTLEADAIGARVAEEEVCSIVAGLRYSLRKRVGAERGALERGRLAVEGGRSRDGALIGQQVLRFAVERPAELEIVRAADVVVILLKAQDTAGERAPVVAFGVGHQVSEARDVRESDLAIGVGQAELFCPVLLCGRRAGNRFRSEE